MKKFLIALVLVLLGLNHGWDYLMSEDYRKYADQTKKPWTCALDVRIGNFNLMMSHYDVALDWYGRVSKRCPKSTDAEQADFKVGECYIGMGRYRDAVRAYEEYVEKYKGAQRSGLAIKAADRLKSGL